MLRPELLSHPNIPKPLHNIAPRKIRGDDWWNKARKEAYRLGDYKCMACGASGKLNAHEVYDINYQTGRVVLKEIVSLCSDCHMFIHSGLLHILYQKNEISLEELKRILSHGVSILKKAKVKPFYSTAMMYMKYNSGFDKDRIEKEILKNYKGFLSEPSCEWSDWYLELDNKKYYSLFRSIREWEQHFKD